MEMTRIVKNQKSKIFYAANTFINWIFYDKQL